MIDKGKSSFLQNIVEEIRPDNGKFVGNIPGWDNAWSQVWCVGLKTRIPSIDMGEGCCYWWDVAKHRIIE